MVKVIYKLKPGIVLLSADDEHLLVATSEARKNGVPHIKQINSAAAFYWRLLESGKADKELIGMIAEHFQMNKISALIKFNSFKEQLFDMGYLTKQEVEYEKN